MKLLVIRKRTNKIEVTPHVDQEFTKRVMKPHGIDPVFIPSHEGFYLEYYTELRNIKLHYGTIDIREFYTGAMQYSWVLDIRKNFPERVCSKNPHNVSKEEKEKGDYLIYSFCTHYHKGWGHYGSTQHYYLSADGLKLFVEHLIANNGKHADGVKYCLFEE